MSGPTDRRWFVIAWRSPLPGLLLIHLTPNELLSRYSAILQLVQVLPVLLLSPLLGVLIDHLELAPVLVGQAALALCATVVVLSSRPLREVEIPSR